MRSLHSAANGLAGFGTKEALDLVLQEANLGVDGTFHSIALDKLSLGHQDSLIGDRAATEQVLREVAGFLQLP